MAVAKSEIDAIMVSLEVEEETSLFLLLGKDGGINRMGSGAVDNQERSFFIGILQEPLFEQFLKDIPDEVWENLGSVFGSPGDHTGKSCVLKLAFRRGEKEDGIAFVYGSESAGPPELILECVLRFVALTQPWYEAQKEMILSSQPGD